jgi:hypothetical protein
MRKILIVAILSILAASLDAQQSGRHFRRPARTPETPAATTQTAEAAAKVSSSHRVQPMRKLRSGRAWSSYHYTRMPQSSPAPTGPSVTDASASKNGARKSPFWGRTLRR